MEQPLFRRPGSSEIALLLRHTEFLMAQQSIALTLDQNTRQHAPLALELMLRHQEGGEKPDTYAEGKVDFVIYTSENSA